MATRNNPIAGGRGRDRAPSKLGLDAALGSRMSQTARPTWANLTSALVQTMRAIVVGVIARARLVLLAKPLPSLGLV